MTRNKLYLAAAVMLLLVALGVILKPPARTHTATAVAAERSRPLNRAPQPAIDPRRAKDSKSLARRSDQFGRPKLTRQQIDDYLSARSRSAAALLTACRLSGDDSLLREACDEFPHDTQVLLGSLRLVTDPAKRLQILKSLKQSDPDNAIADVLSARALFDLGKNEEALAALSQSAGKPLRDYAVLSSQNDEEALLAAGIPPLQAKMAALFPETESLTREMLDVSKSLKKQRESAGLAGDDAAVQTSRDLQLQLAAQVRQGGFMIDSMVASAVEAGALKGIDTPEARARLEELVQEKRSMDEYNRRLGTLRETSVVPESDELLYFDRVKLFGEKAAADWLLEKYPQR
jgi:hypothetical protein